MILYKNQVLNNRSSHLKTRQKILQTRHEKCI